MKCFKTVLTLSKHGSVKLSLYILCFLWNMVFVSISFALKKKEKYPTGKRAHRRKREYREVTSQNTIVGVTVVKGADKHDIFLIDTSKSAELLLTCSPKKLKTIFD